MPMDRGAIDGQLREIGEGERWWEQREFRDLPYILHDGERIRGIVTGRLLGRRRPRLPWASTWLVVATDQRLICLRQERFGRKQMDFYHGQITGVQHRARLRRYQITLDTPRGRFRLQIDKADAFRFLRALEPLLPALPPPPSGGMLQSLPGAALLTPRFLAPPEPDVPTRGELAAVEASVERLEGEVERLQQQVEFLEKLLHQRAEGVVSASTSALDR